MPQISVIMAVYNGLPYVTSAVESILNQSFSDFELIVVNDASTDGTRQALSAYPDPRLKIIDLPQNGGQTAALNVGLRAAQGDFIARQDADDLSKPERLAAQIAYMRANPDCLLLGTAYEQINAKGKVSGTVMLPLTDAEVRQRIAGNDNPYMHGSVMFRREAMQLAGYYREGFRNSQDYDYWLRMAEHGELANLPEALCQYRLHAGQMTFTSYNRMKDEWRLAHDLAQVRARGEDDSAAYEAGAAWLREKYANFVPTPQERRRAHAELWRGKGVSYMNSRNRPMMAYCLLRAFLAEPNNPDFWRGVGNHIPFLRRQTDPH